MPVKLGVVMDPIAAIDIKKDSTFAMLLAAQARGWHVHYLEQADLYLDDGKAHGHMRELSVRDDPNGWFELGRGEDRPLAVLDVVLMRKDPPFDMQYLYSTYILERALADAVMVVNAPAGLRDANEKVFTAWFPQCCAPMRVTASIARLRTFLAAHGQIVVKPLDGMGGESVFRIADGEANTNVILETLTWRGRRTVMAQRFIPEYTQGDKRVLMIDGEPIPYALARIPAPGEARANLATGGKGVGVALGERERWICAQVAPGLRARGLVFAGLDILGDYLTEINVTSPTCIRELDHIYGLDIAGQLLDAIAAKLPG